MPVNSGGGRTTGRGTPRGASMKEDHLESACLDWLGELGWTCVHGDEVSPGGAQNARAR